MAVVSGSERVCGYASEEFSSRALIWDDLIYPQDRGRVAEERRHLLEAPSSSILEYRILTRDGSLRWVKDHKVSSFTEDGMFAGITGIVFDITREKMGEVYQAESNIRFRAIFEQAAVGVAQIDTVTGRFVRVNQFYCDLIGYSNAEMTALTYQDITHPDDLRQDLDSMELLKAGHIRHFSMEKRLFCKDGSTIWVILNVSPLWAEGDVPDYHLAVIEDITRHKQAEEDLLIFSRAVEQSIHSVLITDAEGVIKFVNPTYTRLSGYAAAEVIGQRPNIVSSGRTPVEKYNELWQAITAGREWHGEILNRRKDGQHYWVSASISPIKDSGGVITHYLAIQEDITGRKQIEETLSRQNTYLATLHEISLGILSRLNMDELLQTLVERAGQLVHTPHGSIYMVDPRANVLECRFGSGVLKKYVGTRFQPGEGAAGKIWVNMHPLIVEDYWNWEERSLQIVDEEALQSVIGVPIRLGSQVKGVIILARGSDAGRVFDEQDIHLLERLANLASIAMENARLFDESRRLIQTEQRRSAELAILVSVGEMVAQNHDLPTLARNIGDKVTEIFESDATSILQFDPETNLIHSLYELDSGQYIENIQPFLLGKGLTSRVIASGMPLLVHTADEAATFGAYYPPEAQAESPAVTQSYLGVPIVAGFKTFGVLAVHSYTPHAFDENSTRLLSALSNTIGSAIENARLYAEMEKARKQAETANAAKSVFLASISHEFRTPLNAILGFAQLLRQDSNLHPDQQEYLEIINRSGVNLLALINDVLEISKIESGIIVENDSDFDLFQLFDNLVEMYSLQAREKGLSLSLDYSEATPQYIRTDNLKLWHILNNLIGNAVKFTANGGVSVRIEVEASSGDKEILHIEVEDTGPGIIPQELETIFEPFVQASLGRQRQEGVGLGLSICRRYVQLLGGDITVRSQPGAGSVFAFTIRVHRAGTADGIRLRPMRQILGVNPDQLARRGGPFRLLLADDDKMSRLILARALEPLGFEVREAVNGQEAVDTWKSWSPDLILMDVHMPVLDGCLATRQIRAEVRGKSPVIIALTTATFEEDLKQVQLAGCDDFVRKPYQLADIYHMLSRYLGVVFEYNEPEQPLRIETSTATNPAPGLPEPIDFSGVPAGIWLELRSATLAADIDQIVQLVAKIGKQNPSAGQYLQTLAENFEYRKILAAVGPAGEEDGAEPVYVG